MTLGQALFFNTTWEARRGKILPGLEFFPWVLSFLLELLVFAWVFWIFLHFSVIFFTIFYIFLLQFNISKIFVNKNDLKSTTSPKILSFDRKIKFFFLSFPNWRENPPRGWVFSLSFWLEFFPWVLVFSTAGVKKKPGLVSNLLKSKNISNGLNVPSALTTLKRCFRLWGW